MPYYNRDPKRDHNFDNHPGIRVESLGIEVLDSDFGFRVQVDFWF